MKHISNIDFGNSSVMASQLNSTEKYLVLELESVNFTPGALIRLERLMDESPNVALIYSDYYEIKAGKRSLVPTIDYQSGSEFVRSSFSNMYLHMVPFYRENY